DVFGTGGDHGGGVGQYGAGTDGAQPVLFEAHAPGEGVGHALAGDLDVGEFLGDVRHDPLGGVGGGGGAVVGDQVQQRAVRFVADCRDERSAARSGGAHHGLVGERQQVLHRAATTGDHDDLHVRVRVEFGDRFADLWHAVGSLHGYFAHFE